jgi:hypothetical protein
VYLVLNGGILGWKTKGVPAERMDYVVALHSFHPSHHVANHVVTDVPDVRMTRRIGKHHQAIKLWLRGICFYLKRPAFSPTLLPLLLNCLRGILGHDWGHTREPANLVAGSNSMGVMHKRSAGAARVDGTPDS